MRDEHRGQGLLPWPFLLPGSWKAGEPLEEPDPPEKTEELMLWSGSAARICAAVTSEQRQNEDQLQNCVY